MLLKVLIEFISRYGCSLALVGLVGLIIYFARGLMPRNYRSRISVEQMNLRSVVTSTPKPIRSLEEQILDRYKSVQLTWSEEFNFAEPNFVLDSETSPSADTSQGFPNESNWINEQLLSHTNPGKLANLNYNGGELETFFTNQSGHISSLWDGNVIFDSTPTQQSQDQNLTHGIHLKLLNLKNVSWYFMNDTNMVIMIKAQLPSYTGWISADISLVSVDTNFPETDPELFESIDDSQNQTVIDRIEIASYDGSLLGINGSGILQGIHHSRSGSSDGVEHDGHRLEVDPDEVFLLHDPYLKNSKPIKSHTISHNEFHIFSLTWSPRGGGQLVWTVDGTETLSKHLNGGLLFGGKFHFELTLQRLDFLSHLYHDNEDVDRDPQSSPTVNGTNRRDVLLIDYIRIYECELD